MKKIAALLFALILVCALAYAAMPYLTVQKLTRALETEDAAAVDRYVDFEAVQASLQDDFAMRLGLTPQGPSPADRIATSLSHMFLSMAITPQAMVYVFKEQPRRESMGLSASLGTLLGRGRWSGPDAFMLTNAEKQPTMLLARRGLLTWNVVAVRLK